MATNEWTKRGKIRMRIPTRSAIRGDRWVRMVTVIALGSLSRSVEAVPPARHGGDTGVVQHRCLGQHGGERPRMGSSILPECSKSKSTVWGFCPCEGLRGSTTKAPSLYEIRLGIYD